MYEIEPDKASFLSGLFIGSESIFDQNDGAWE
jgi:hypothetical protein